MEELAVDKRAGFFVNHDLAGYEVPVHADIPHQEVIFLDETDPISSPMKAKGVGELGICGVGAAIANAIYNADRHPRAQLSDHARQAAGMSARQISAALCRSARRRGDAARQRTRHAQALASGFATISKPLGQQAAARAGRHHRHRLRSGAPRSSR
jgi:hypothetical protein